MSAEETLVDEDQGDGDEPVEGDHEEDAQVAVGDWIFTLNQRYIRSTTTTTARPTVPAYTW